MLTLVAAGLSGGAVDLWVMWKVAPLLALVTAPLAGSLFAGCAGLALHLITPRDEPRDEGAAACPMDTDAMVSALRGAAELGRRVVPAVPGRQRHAA